MTAPLVNPVVVAKGADVTLVFKDQNGVTLPTGADAPDGAVITAGIVGINPPLPAGVASWVIASDFRSAVIHGDGVGEGFVELRVTKGPLTLVSQQFKIKVPWSVTEVGTATS